MQESAENCSSEENSELSVKQQQFIAALIAGNTIVVAAAAVGIAERTAHNWLKQPAFNQVYKAAKDYVFDEALSELKDNVGTAIATLKRNMTSDTVDPAVQVRAANIWLTQAIQTHKLEELAAKVAEFDAAVKAIRG